MLFKSEVGEGSVWCMLHRLSRPCFSQEVSLCRRCVLRPLGSVRAGTGSDVGGGCPAVLHIRRKKVQFGKLSQEPSGRRKVKGAAVLQPSRGCPEERDVTALFVRKLVLRFGLLNGH